MMTNRETQTGAALTIERLGRASFTLRGCLVILLALLFQLSAQSAAAQSRLTKLDPESVVVQLEGGSGATDMTFALAQGAAIPEVRCTSAVGSSNTIPASDISFKWVSSQSAQPSPESQPGQPAARRALLGGQLTVNTRANIEPNTNYAGRLIFYWPDAADPQPVNFVVSDRTALAFSVEPATQSLTLLQSQPDTILLRIKNTGRAAIHKLSFSISGLIDSETQRRLLLPEGEPAQVKDFGSTPLEPSREAEFQFRLPHPVWAGSYMGTVDVIANERARQSVNLTLRSRGPAPVRNAYWIPFLLFAATLMLGYVLSTKLENWFNLGGLERAQAQLSLRKSERELARILRELDQWATPEGFPQTRIRLLHDLNELRELYRDIPGLTRQELVAEAKRFAASATLAGVLESAVRVALKQWGGEPVKLKRVLGEMDAAEVGADPIAYRLRLRLILESAAKQDPADSASAFDANAALPDVPSTLRLETRIRRMARLERLVAAAVVFILAYQLFYARDFAFGTLLDYIQVFLWSLGLTQVGTQIITRARSSYTPSQ